MLTLLPDWLAFSIFLVATLAVGAAPGPGMMFAIAGHLILADRRLERPYPSTARS